MTFINGFYLFQDFLKKQGFRDGLTAINGQGGLSNSYRKTTRGTALSAKGTPEDGWAE
ncbi:hypothetical protein [Comamonas aquatica]|uniref:hypothetical protein n=1 Tax=Comamonas aquatica TaxID=225991 RepID=UPI001B36C5AF|nr:hypothetical protein [Comamonas aquatica]QTX20976.1 hypothetical protein KAQ61_00220 [Comamonas aquatica]